MGDGILDAACSPSHHHPQRTIATVTATSRQPLRNYLLGLVQAADLPNLAEAAPVAAVPAEPEAAAKRQRVEGGCVRRWGVASCWRVVGILLYSAGALFDQPGFLIWAACSMQHAPVLYATHSSSITLPASPCAHQSHNAHRSARRPTRGHTAGAEEAGAAAAGPQQHAGAPGWRTSGWIGVPPAAAAAVATLTLPPISDYNN